MKLLKRDPSQNVGRGGKTALVNMTLAQIRDVDAGFCDRLQSAGLRDSILCRPYLDRTIGDLARAEDLDVSLLLKVVHAAPAGKRQDESYRQGAATLAAPQKALAQSEAFAGAASQGTVNLAMPAPALPAQPPVRYEFPSKLLSANEQATLTEAELRPNFDTEPRGGCFAPVEGLKTVKSGATSFFHHGWYVVDEPCAGVKRPASRDTCRTPSEEPIGARIPGDVALGEIPLDLASESLIEPKVDSLTLSAAERSYPDTRHMARGGSYMASR